MLRSKQLTCIGDVSGTLCSSLGSKESKDTILNVVRVVLLKQVVDSKVNVAVSVFLRNLTLGHKGRAGSRDTNEGKSDDGVLHDEFLYRFFRS